MLGNLLASLVRRGTGAKRFLNVGGGSKQAPLPEHFAGWEHVLLDIQAGPGVDLAMDARKLADLPAEAFDAVYCSHNLEHYYAHDVPRVLAGFAHVLKPGGFAEIRVPDIEAVLRAMTERRLDIADPLYRSQAGPISVHDVLYGFGTEIARGNEYYAHKTGFTNRSLHRALAAAGFAPVQDLEPLGGYELRVMAWRKASTTTSCSASVISG